MISTLLVMIYETNQRHHYGLCATYQAVTTGERSLDRHRSEHDGWEITFTPFVATSDAAMEVRGKTFRYTPDTFLLYNGEEVHTELYGSSATATHRVNAVVLRPDFLNSIFDPEGVSARELLFDSVQIRVTPHLRQLLETLFALRKVRDVSRFTYDCLTTDLTTEIVLTQKHSFSARLRDRASTGHFPGNLARAKRTLSERALDPSLRLDDVAASAGLSKFHFVRAFRAQTGKSPRQYLNALRIDLAKEKLAAGSSVLDTALVTGFASVSTFNKAFRKAIGCGPSQYSWHHSTLRI